MMMLIPMISKFQSTLPVWGATEGHGNFGSVDGDFNPRSPCGERRNSANRPTTRRYFNPRSPCGERQCQFSKMIKNKEFQSTLPVWGATAAIMSGDETMKRFQSTLPVWGATLEKSPLFQKISDFNPRSPCGERPRHTFIAGELTKFQSTLPVWGATPVRALYILARAISIHAPRVGSDNKYLQDDKQAHISIHAPRVGSDREAKLDEQLSNIFQSTLPVWGATLPHPGCAGLRRFQSTLPVWGATDAQDVTALDNQFQSTLPVWGATSTVMSSGAMSRYFNPRSPCGERRRYRR